MSPTVPPNKTLVYSISRQIALNLNTGDPDTGRELGTPFPDLREGVRKLLNDCPEYRGKFDEHYTESERAARSCQGASWFAGDSS